MKRLLSINNYYYRRGGAETVFFEHNRLLENTGWGVIPFAMRHPKNLECDWSEYFVKEIEFGRNYSLLEKAKRAADVIYSKQAQRNLEKLIRKIRPQIAHGHNIYHHISPSILPVLRRRGIPIVLTLHDLKLLCPAYTMLSHDGICDRCKGGATYNVVRHRCIKNSLVLSSIIYAENIVNDLLGSYSRNVSRFVVPSRFYRDKMVGWGWDADRFVYIPNFIDANEYIPKYEAGKSFLYFGRLAPQKGISTLIRAASIAGAPLRIAGTGPEEPELRRLADSSGAAVTFLGFLNGKALHDEIKMARATVLPSEWYENAPMSVLESYALGTPVIGAEIGGIPELIRDEETGNTFKSGDPHNLAAVLSKYKAFSDQRLTDIGRNARGWVEQQFSVERYRERILKLYEEV